MGKCYDFYKADRYCQFIWRRIRFFVCKNLQYNNRGNYSATPLSNILKAMDFKYTAIILSKTDVGETDRIYTFYSREAGKMRALGKGVRKPASKLASNLESLTMAEIFIAKGRGMGKITGSIVVDTFSGLKENLDALRKTFAVLEIFTEIVGEEQRDEKIFQLLHNFLKASAEKGTSPDKVEILSLGFLLKLLDYSGYRLEAEKCVGCGRKPEPEGNCFSPSRGGILCAGCRSAENKKIDVSAGAIKLIRIILKNKIENLVKLRAADKDLGGLKAVVSEAVNWI